VPAPSHFGGGRRLPEVHIALPQVVFAGTNRQAPLPLQKPSCPHAVPSDAHSLPGSVPLETKPQVPFAAPPVCAARHDEHAPLQAVLQQTPSTQ
jgi:hypothetical protein